MRGCPPGVGPPVKAIAKQGRLGTHTKMIAGTAALVLAGVATPFPVETQLRRGAAIQPLATVAGGDFVFGAGVSARRDAGFPLSGLTGDLYSYAALHAAYGFADRAVFEITGTLASVLRVESAGLEPPAPVEGAGPGSRLTDVGDFELAVTFLPGRLGGLRFGGYLAAKLPNATEASGIGTNTTDVTFGGAGAWGGKGWQLTWRAGVSILQVPAQVFEQSDVFAYAAEWLWSPAGSVRVAVGTRGLANTRPTVRVGTEDTGEALLSGEWRLGNWVLDITGGRGYTTRSGSWTAGAGVAYRITNN